MLQSYVTASSVKREEGIMEKSLFEGFEKVSEEAKQVDEAAYGASHAWGKSPHVARPRALRYDPVAMRLSTRVGAAMRRVAASPARSGTRWWWDAMSRSRN